MRVISKARLRQCWETPGQESSKAPLLAWYKFVNSRDTNWTCWGDVRRDFPSASIFQDCVIFNIGGNKCRLVTKVGYAIHRVYIVKAMTHREYDRAAWKVDCQCADGKNRPVRHKDNGGES